MLHYVTRLPKLCDNHVARIQITTHLAQYPTMPRNYFRERRYRERNNHNNFHLPLTVHVANLPLDVTEQELRCAVEVFGPIESCFINCRRGKAMLTDSYTYAFLNFVHDNDALKALNSKLFLAIRGRKLTFNRRKFNSPPEQSSDSKQQSEPDTTEYSVKLGNPDHFRSRFNNDLNTVVIHPKEECPESDHGLVLLIDGIPANMGAKALHSLLEQHLNTPVGQTVVFKDEDHVGNKQGLARFVDPTVVDYLCVETNFTFNDLTLEFSHSQIKSIRLLHHRYSGGLSYYAPDEPTDSEGNFSGSMCNSSIQTSIPLETSRMHSGENDQRARVECKTEPNDLVSPVVDTPGLFSPGLEEFTPATEIHRDEKIDESFSSGMDDVQEHYYAVNYRSPDVLKTIELPNNQLKQPENVFAPFQRSAAQYPSAPFNLPHVSCSSGENSVPMTGCSCFHIISTLSSTLIVDNIQDDAKENFQHNLQSVCGEFGGLQAIDLVNCGGNLHRAFVCYENHFPACSAFHTLNEYFKGTQLNIRFA